MRKNFGKTIDKKVFISGGLICLLFLILTVIAPDQANAVFSKILSVFSADFGWLYLVVVVFFIVFLFYLALSKYGKIKLGKDTDQPAYSRRNWFFMLFAAGMGIGLVFWSVAEPMSHYLLPPYGEGSTSESATLAMRYVFTHWGIHPWACYGIIGLPLAYFQFRKDRPALLSSCVEPIFGEKKVGSVVGSVVNVLAVFATVFGMATSLGLGAMQINSGLHYVLSIPCCDSVIFGIIAVTSVVFITSSVSGIDKGMRILSNANMVILIILLIFVFFSGATLFVTNFFVNSLGEYISNLITTSFWTDPFDKSDNWLSSWTIFYWAWWISWGPFVGGFIARISRGRTIREFICGTLLCPSILSFVFMAVMGGNAIHLDMQGVSVIADATQENISYALFALLSQFPLPKLLSLMAIILVFVFFVTSADSSTYVCATLTAKGVQNPPSSLKIFWGVIESSVAAVLLYVGGLSALRSAAIIAALPLMFVCLLMTAALMKSLKQDIS